MAKLHLGDTGAEKLWGSADLSKGLPREEERFYSVFGNAEKGNFIFCVDKNASFYDGGTGTNTHCLLIKRFGQADQSSQSYIVDTVKHKRLFERVCTADETKAVAVELATFTTPNVEETNNVHTFSPYGPEHSVTWTVTKFQQKDEVFERDVFGFKSPMNAIEVAKFRAVLGEDDFDRGFQET